jgi:lipopolysaccharide/colanic/teichoic acid biosynthesis glycosyltransferase
MKLGKRVFDVVCTVPGLIVLSPLFAVAALLIKLEDGGPVFFRQERVGRSGRPFRMWKFRSMVVDAPRLGAPLTVGRDPRITRVGWWLRKLKIDEFPQLLNVLTGEMSLVGPRPEVPRFVADYTPEQRSVLTVAPGITDPASVKFRHESDVLAASADPERTYLLEIMPEKLRINLDYQARATVWSDMLVILRTLRALVK